MRFLRVLRGMFTLQGWRNAWQTISTWWQQRFMPDDH